MRFAKIGDQVYVIQGGADGQAISGQPVQRETLQDAFNLAQNNLAAFDTAAAAVTPMPAAEPTPTAPVTPAPAPVTPAPVAPVDPVQPAPAEPVNAPPPM